LTVLCRSAEALRHPKAKFRLITAAQAPRHFSRVET
jgi:hypothetical protein